MDREQMIEVMWSVLSPDGATQTDLIDRGNLSAALSALEAAGVVMVQGWRAIDENTPRDGSAILLRYLGEPVIGSWSESYGHWIGQNVRECDGQQTITSLRDGLGRGAPDLWMPLLPLAARPK